LKEQLSSISEVLFQPNISLQVIQTPQQGALFRPAYCRDVFISVVPVSNIALMLMTHLR